jgi:predicted Ser/Thr protein kinase
MTPDRWRQVTEAFHGALARELATRGAFLDQVCAGDAELRAEVEAMLAAHRDAGRFGEDPVVARSAAVPTRDQAESGRPTRSDAALGSRVQEPTAAFLPGTVLARRYRIVAPLGRGGMGEVYRADDLKLGQAVALKFLPPSLRQDPNRRQRLRDEVKLARLVAHPNVCRVWDVVETDAHEFLTMEYVDGEDLASLLRRIGRLPEDRAVRMARELCAGLGAVHDQGLLHRDLKPANVMVDGRGRVRLADFGLAAVAGHAAGADLRSGTPAYMSPEQREGREVTVRSDVYALGLVLYEVFTGEEARREEHPTPSQRVRDLDPAIDRLIERCLERDPALRPPSASAVSASLPGGDPLAAALAAGETPSPELVAAAEGTGGMRPSVAWACLAAVAVGLPLIAWVGDRVSPFYLDLDKPVEVLAYEAQQLIGDLAPVRPPVDHAHGFALQGDEPASQRLVFWYRQSPRSLFQDLPQFRPSGREMGPNLPGRSLYWEMSFDRPPYTVPGMAGVRLDAHGRLIEYVRAPGEEDAPAQGTPDWSAVLRRAGLQRPRSAPPEGVPPVFGEERLAWDCDREGVAIRAEAATFRGRPVWFRAEKRAAPRQASNRGAPEALGFLLGAIVLLAVFLARRHMRLGRADRDGARRIAAFFGLVIVLALLLTGPRLDFPRLLTLWIYASSYTFVCWTLYLALEPLARRSWPQALVSWTRLLRGRLVDPLVGRDILIGVLCGMAVSLFGQVGRLAGGTAAARWPAWPGLLSGGAFVTGATIGNVGSKLLECLFILLLLALLRRLLRSSWAAVAAALCLIIVPQYLGNPTDLVTHLLTRGVLWGVIIQVGLLAGIVALCVRFSLGLALMTTHLGAWYADSATAGMVVTIGLAAWGAYGVLGAQRLFRESALSFNVQKA